LIKFAIEIDGVFQDLRNRGGGAKLPHKPSRVPCRTRSQFILLEQDHIRLVIAREMIGGGAPDDASADDDELRV
jgi:hypothetical protein